MCESSGSIVSIIFCDLASRQWVISFRKLKEHREFNCPLSAKNVMHLTRAVWDAERTWNEVSSFAGKNVSLRAKSCSFAWAEANEMESLLIAWAKTNLLNTSERYNFQKCRSIITTTKNGQNFAKYQLPSEEEVVLYALKISECGISQAVQKMLFNCF